MTRLLRRIPVKLRVRILFGMTVVQIWLLLSLAIMSIGPWRKFASDNLANLASSVPFMLSWTAGFHWEREKQEPIIFQALRMLACILLIFLPYLEHQTRPEQYEITAAVTVLCAINFWFGLRSMEAKQELKASEDSE